MSGSNFTDAVNRIQREMEHDRARRVAQFPEGALGLTQPPVTRPGAFKRYSEGGYTYDASGITELNSIDAEMSRQIVDEEKRQIEREREIQQSMACGVAPGVHFGWWAYVFDGEHRWRWWRPSRRWAEDVARFVLRNEVRLRQRRWANQHPEMRNAKDLWIVPPTDLESWIEAYKQAEGKL